MADRIETPLGGWVQLSELSPDIVEQIGGPGLMLRMGMQDPRDIRYAEIVLSSAGVAALVAGAAAMLPDRERDLRELHHFETEQENERLRHQLATPPPGWFTFGTHVDAPELELEFWGEDGGVPLWERPFPANEGAELLHVREIDGAKYWRKGPHDRWHLIPRKPDA